MRPAKPIPVVAARSIAEQYAYDQVIIIARKVGEGGLEHVTTYGRDKDHCAAAARIGDFLKFKVMGWVREEMTVHYDHRVSELLEANNREVERRRAAEGKLAQLAEPDEDFIECVERHLRPINPLHDSVVRAVVHAIAEVLS